MSEGESETQGQPVSDEPYFQDLCDKLVPQAIVAGLPLKEFWESTLDDVRIYFEAYEEKRKEDYGRLYTSAQLIGIAVASYNPMSQGKLKFPSIHECFPKLFKEETQNKAQDWRIIKDRLMTFAKNHNEKERLKDNDC